MRSGFRIDRRAALTGLGATLVAKPGFAQSASVDVVVIGAGLSGLNAALVAALLSALVDTHFLHQAADGTYVRTTAR